MDWIPKMKDWLNPSRMTGWLGPVIERAAPIYSLKRHIAYQRLQRLKEITKARKDYGEIKRNFELTDSRSFELLDGSRNKAKLKMAGGNIDSDTYSSLESLRNYIRQQEFNNGLVAGPIERWTNHVVGRGLLFQSRVRADKKGMRLGGMGRITEAGAEEYNFLVEKYFKKWQKRADQKDILTFYEMQWVAEAAMMRDGESLVIIRQSQKNIRPIPYCLDIVEIDRLRTPTELIMDPQVRNGIRFDEEGAASIYYVLKRHPGDSLQLGLKVEDYEEIPAYNPNGSRKVIHLFKTIRPEQTRGFSRFSAALNVLNMAFRISEAEMFAALEDACMFGVVKSSNPIGFQNNATVTGTQGTDFAGNTVYPKLHGFDIGQIQYLNNNEDFIFHTPKRPNEKFAEVYETFCSGAANVLQMPTEVFLQKWKDINYSNARTILLQFYIPIFLRQQYLSDHLCDPIYENVASELVTYGKVRAPSFDKRRDDYLECDWVPPEREWVDPQSETKGMMNELDMRVTSPGQICAAKGKDFDDVIEEFARNLAKEKEVKERYGVEFPSYSGKVQTSGQGQGQAQGQGQTGEGGGQNAGQNNNQNKAKIVDIMGKKNG